jgi:hypothetical protein
MVTGGNGNVGCKFELGGLVISFRDITACSLVPWETLGVAEYDLRSDKHGLSSRI